MHFEEYFTQSIDEINNELDILFETWQHDVSVYNSKLGGFITLLQEQCSGGKRLRGTLLMLGYELLKKSHTKDIAKIAGAYEIFQTSLLIHDDIIDKSPTRRGRPTLYQQMGGDHYGISQSIIIGDLGFFYAAKVFAESNFSEKEKNKALQLCMESMYITGLGQVLDVMVPQEKDTLQISALKTAQYTIIGPLQIGAAFAGANSLLLSHLAKFGKSLGIAFQIQDDILGIFGDEVALGKSTISDITEGKNTLLIHEARKKATPKQKKMLDTYYGKANLSQAEILTVKEIFIQTGALSYTTEKMLDFAQQARFVIKEITNVGVLQVVFEEMIDFLVKRKK